MTESRTELLTWVNDLLSLNITKLEHCGSGAAYCQVFDSIYGDIPVGKVKFTGKREYEHIHNYKILQSAFNNHGVDKIIPVERLVKCKYQDNLDFLQWMKKYWDTYYPGGVYDAVQRRAKSDYSANEDKPQSPSRRGAETPTSPSRSLPSRRSSNRQSKDGIPSLPQSPTRRNRTETASTTGDAAESPKRRVGKNNNHSSTSTAGSLTINIKPTKGPPSTSGDSERPVTQGRRVPGSIHQRQVSASSTIHHIREEPYEEEPVTPSPAQNKPAQGSNPAANSNSGNVLSNNNGRKVPVQGNAVNLRSRTSSTAREQQYDWELQHNQILSLRKENNALRMELDNLRNVAHALERERNFYFSKLRDIEIVIRQKVDKIQIDRAVIPLLSSIQGIMYKTEDGFENLSPRYPPMGMHIFDEFPQDHVRKEIDTLQYLDRVMPSTSVSGLSKPAYISSPPLRTNNFGTTAAPFVGQHETQIPQPGTLTRQDSKDWKQSSHPPSGSQPRRLSETAQNRTNIPPTSLAQPNPSYLKPQPATEDQTGLSTGALSTDNDLLSAVADVDASSESRFQDAEDFDPSGSVHTSNTEISQLKGSVIALNNNKSAASSRGNLTSKSVFGSGQVLNKLAHEEAAGNILDETPPANFAAQLSETQLLKATERVKSLSNLPSLPKKNPSSASLRERIRENTKDPEGILDGHGETWFGALAS